MSEIQINGMQMAVDVLSVLAPMVVAFGVGITLIKMFLRFLKGDF